MDEPDHASIAERAARHAALGDPVRLAIVEQLASSDRSPSELRRMFGLESNLLAHHLDVLQRVGLIERSPSTGDQRRRYVRLRPRALEGIVPAPTITPSPALFVCSENSARSQLAAALWRHRTGQAATSAGTHPAARVHPGAVAAAERAGLDLSGAAPQSLDEVTDPPALVVTVCDRAHEEIAPGDDWLHWSVPDPVRIGTSAAFDATVGELTDRMRTMAAGAP